SVPERAVNTSGNTTRAYSAQGLAFRYPNAWLATDYTGMPGTLGSTLVYLSDARLKAPCVHTSPAPGQESIVCKRPVATLSPGQFLVTWDYETELSRERPQLKPPHATTVAGRPAFRNVLRPGPCGQIHADETIYITVYLATHLYGMEACIRG